MNKHKIFKDAVITPVTILEKKILSVSQEIRLINAMKKG